jgi:TonB family protein
MKAVFAVCLWLAVPAMSASAQVPRDTPPPSITNAQRERELKAAINAGTATKATYDELATLLKRRGDGLGAIDALRGAASVEPQTAEEHHRVAVLLWDFTRADTTLDASARKALIEQGIADEDRALRLQPEYMEALTYKNILLRLLANATADPVEQKRLVDEADGLRNRVIAAQRARQVGASAAGASGTAGAPGPPPPPFIGFGEPFDQAAARLTPVRVGGNIRVPVKLRDVKPVYPAEALRERVQGVVIIEALIGLDGNIENARVLRSIPMLDDAALTAVSQWRFTSTELNGAPVPVIMTVTVNFTLQ